MNSVATAVNFTVPEFSWAALAPVLCVLCGGILAVLAESFVPVRARRASVFGIAVVALIASAVALVMRWAAVLGSPQSLGEYIEDPLTVAAQGILVLIAFFAVLVIADRSEARDGAFAGQPSDRPGSSDEERSDSKGYQRSEMFALVLFSTGGMMIFPAANSYIALFVALEVMSLPLYILAATARRRRQLSQEAALKYFILGAFSSGFMLMGSAFLYGYSGSLLISDAATPTAQTAGMQILLLMGTVMVMVGLLFKVGAAPFHAWTPDVYTGAPTPVTGFMAAAVKLAAFGAMLRFFQVVAAPLQWSLIPIMVVVIILTMLVGTFAGVVQMDVKRMLAYSSIAHAGFILMGVISLLRYSAGHVLFYVLAYAVATIGAFGVITLVRSRDDQDTIGGEVTDLRRWAGLGKTNPALASAMLIFLLSFAGIPFTGGFIAKFVVFSDAFAAGNAWLVALALACSAVTAFYYFRLVRVMFFSEPREDVAVVRSEGFTGVAITVCAVGTIALGLFPSPVLSLLNQVVVLLP